MVLKVAANWRGKTPLWMALLLFLPVLILVIWGGRSLHEASGRASLAQLGVQSITKGLSLVHALEAFRDYRILIDEGEAEFHQRHREFQELVDYRFEVLGRDLERYSFQSIHYQMQLLRRDYDQLMEQIEQRYPLQLPSVADTDQLIERAYAVLHEVSREAGVSVDMDPTVRAIMHNVLYEIPSLVSTLGDSREAIDAWLQEDSSTPRALRIRAVLESRLLAIDDVQRRLMVDLDATREVYPEQGVLLDHASDSLQAVLQWRLYLERSLSGAQAAKRYDVMWEGLKHLQQVFDTQETLLALGEYRLAKHHYHAQLSQYVLYVGSALFYLVSLGIALLSYRVNRRQLVHDAEAQAKTTFLTRMSYEIRTPMNGVMGMTELLKETSLDDKQLEYVNVIYESGWSLLQIIDDILSYARVEVGNVELESIPFNLYRLVSETVKTYSLRAAEHGIVVLFDVDPFLPDKIIGDPGRLRQVLSNLISNAIRFSHDGYIEVRVAADIEAGGDDIVLRFSVKDYGVGVMKDKQEKIFEMFDEGSNASKDAVAEMPTGIGLVVSKQLVRLMGGEIGVDSELGEGAEFWFTARLRTESRSWGDGYSDVRALGDFRILLIDADGYLNQFAEKCKGLQQVNLDYAYSLNDAERMIIDAGEEYYEAIVVTQSAYEDECLPVLLDLKQRASASILGLLLSMQRAPSISRKRYGIDFIINQYHFSLELLLGVIKDATQGEGSLYVREKSKLSEKNFSHLRVLVAEDNYVSQMVVLGLLRKMNISPLTVSNGEEAYRAYQEHHHEIDVILMDCDMPVIDGYTSAKMIREFEKKNHLQETKIYTLSAHALPEVVKKAREAGMNSCLNKPISYRDLALALEHAEKRKD